MFSNAFLDFLVLFLLPLLLFSLYKHVLLDGLTILSTLVNLLLNLLHDLSFLCLLSFSELNQLFFSLIHSKDARLFSQIDVKEQGVRLLLRYLLLDSLKHISLPLK